ncbi:MAG: CZB domain-containing protein [Campylobacterales bacterium]|nr:CZB domain-containing protein [Campylobacterales bacterium]
MTNKEKFIHNMHQARTAHIRWVNAIKLLVSGIDVDEKQITLDATHSQFGLWYYNEAMLFSLGTSQLVLEEIENFLTELHDKYTKIYPIYYGNRKRNLLSDFLGGRTRASAHEIELSQRFYEDIIQLSDKLKHKLRIFEAQLMSLTDEKYDELIRFTQQEKSISIEPNILAASIDEGSYHYGARGR